MTHEHFTLLFEDDSIFVVEKPAGLHSVRAGIDGHASLADELLKVYPFLGQVAEKAGDAGLVQRWDRDTSGVLIGAKRRAAWLALQEQLAAGEMHKEYLALVHGRFETTKTLTSYLGSPYRRAKKVRVYTSTPGVGHRALSGTTKFSPVQDFHVGQVSLIRAIASPARRHQIRAHAAHLGHPLVGDSLYGSEDSYELRIGDTRSFFLHASVITFLHPISGESITVTSPNEDELQRIRQRLNEN